jgi:hypothetical protein
MLSEHYELYNLNNLTTEIDFSRKAIPFMTAKATIFDVKPELALRVCCNLCPQQMILSRQGDGGVLESCFTCNRLQPLVANLT